MRAQVVPCCTHRDRMCRHDPALLMYETIKSVSQIKVMTHRFPSVHAGLGLNCTEASPVSRPIHTADADSAERIL
jgi:hypothetical protein